MFLQLRPPFDRGLVLRIQVNPRFKCPFFIFLHEDNVGHPLVGGWDGDMLTLPRVRDKQQFTSLLQMFYFLHGTQNVQIPMCWSNAFQWTPAVNNNNNWSASQQKPLHHFLQVHNCYIHEEPPYQIFYRSTKLPCARRQNMERSYRERWTQHQPIQIYTNPNPKQNRQIWKRFLTQHRILPKDQCQVLFDGDPPSQAQPISPRLEAPETEVL